MNAFERNLEEELEVALTLIEADEGKKVLVVGIVSTGQAYSLLARSVSEGTVKRDARAFIAGLEHEIARLKKLIGELP